MKINRKTTAVLTICISLLLTGIPVAAEDTAGETEAAVTTVSEPDSSSGEVTEVPGTTAPVITDTGSITEPAQETESTAETSVPEENEETTAETGETTETGETEETEETEEDEILDLTDDEEEAGNGVPIVPDGNFDDWEDKPHTQIDWDRQEEYNTPHRASLIRDDQYVYLHIKMSDDTYQAFNGNNYIFTVDGVTMNVVVTPPDGYNYTEGITPLVVRNENGYGIIESSGGFVLKQAESGLSDEAEIRIPLSFFSDNPDMINEITFYTPNLGGDPLVITGTPTMPVIASVTGLLFAGASVAAIKKKGKKK